MQYSHSIAPAPVPPMERLTCAPARYHCSQDTVASPRFKPGPATGSLIKQPQRYIVYITAMEPQGSVYAHKDYEEKLTRRQIIHKADATSPSPRRCETPPVCCCQTLAGYRRYLTSVLSALSRPLRDTGLGESCRSCIYLTVVSSRS